MNSKIAKVVLPAVLSIGTLGATALASTAGASTTKATKHTTTTVKHAPAPKAAVTLTGSVVKTQAKKDVFWFKDGAKTFRVSYTTKTTFAKGTAASLVKGAAVSVTGTEVGKAGSVIRATKISA
jgi:uncharacterized protein YdeI (BOF family)